MMAKRIAVPLMAGAIVVTAWNVPATCATIVVGPGGNLQAALDQARGGDVILLQAGATFEGNFVLPAKDGDRPITIRTAADERRLPGPTERMHPDFAAQLPKLRSPNNQPALRTERGSSHWRIIAIEFVGTGVAGDIIALGDGSNAQRDTEGIPEDLVLDRVLVRGDPSRGQKRGIALNSGQTTIRNSYIGDIKSAGQESQAIAGWNGPGPYLIENNVLEAAGVNILFGGADPAIQNLVPSDITIRRNFITKNVSWRGASWTVKNLVELKNARRVLIEGNTIENTWVAAQVGYAVLFTVRNSNGKAPWAIIENVMFRNNVVRHASSGVNILGSDSTAKSETANGIVIQNNLFDDINHRNWGGNGVFLLVGNGAQNVTVNHNTVMQTGNVVTAYGETRGTRLPMPGFRFTNNMAPHNAYGIFGNSVGVGTRAIGVYFPDAVIRSNVLAGGQSSRYPAGNFFPSMSQFLADFMDAAKGDLRLNPRSSYKRAASDGADLGVSFDLLNRALQDPDQDR